MFMETIKSTLTKQLIIEVPPQFVDDGFVSFIEQNIRQNPEIIDPFQYYRYGGKPRDQPLFPGKRLFDE